MVVAAIAVTYVLSLVAFTAGTHHVQNTVAVAAAPVAAAPTPTDTGATEVVAGEKIASFDNREYRCKAGFVPIQILLGKTVKADGGVYHLTPHVEYDTQTSVDVSLKLDTAKHTAVPAIIINTAAHRLRPDLYPQSVLQIGLKPGDSADWPLTTNSYSDNYNTPGGITDITLCTAQVR